MPLTPSKTITSEESWEQYVDDSPYLTNGMSDGEGSCAETGTPHDEQGIEEEDSPFTSAITLSAFPSTAVRSLSSSSLSSRSSPSHSYFTFSTTGSHSTSTLSTFLTEEDEHNEGVPEPVDAIIPVRRGSVRILVDVAVDVKVEDEKEDGIGRKMSVSSVVSSGSTDAPSSPPTFTNSVVLPSLSSFFPPLAPFRPFTLSLSSSPTTRSRTTPRPVLSTLSASFESSSSYPSPPATAMPFCQPTSSFSGRVSPLSTSSRPSTAGLSSPLAPFGLSSSFRYPAPTLPYYSNPRGGSVVDGEPFASGKKRAAAEDEGWEDRRVLARYEGMYDGRDDDAMYEEWDHAGADVQF